jgi:hypothetical protein
MREEFVFLNNLRESGVTNMFGAAPYLQDEFSLGRMEARDILTEWMEWVSDNPENAEIGIDEDLVDVLSIDDDADAY